MYIILYYIQITKIGVLVMDVYSGKVKSIISLNSPIRCYSPGYTNRNKNRNIGIIFFHIFINCFVWMMFYYVMLHIYIVYCGTKSERFGGAVYSIDADTYEIIPDKTYHTKAMTHATGTATVTILWNDYRRILQLP